MELGNPGDVKSVGSGVHELRIDFGPGYRVYFGREGADIVILVGGGSKKGQQQDIETAKKRWADYKKRTQETRKKEGKKTGRRQPEN
jgi:putative addiction module killer protein